MVHTIIIFGMLVGLHLYAPLDANQPVLAGASTAVDDVSDHEWKKWEVGDLANSLDELLVEGAGTPQYWKDKPPMTAIFHYPFSGAAGKEDYEQVQWMKAGWLRPYPVFKWMVTGMPPPWDQNPAGDSVWDFYLHTLRWTEPLIWVWLTNGDRESMLLAKRIIRDWIEKNVPPGCSSYAWYDHAIAGRLRLLCWFWERWRINSLDDWDFARLLLSSIYQHGKCVCDPAMYPGHSNHGLEMTGALLAAALTIPEFKESFQWKKLGLQRLSEYCAFNFCPAGFHLEQSPFYHWYVLDRLNRITRFLHDTGEPLSSDVRAAVRRIAMAWPYLRKPDGVLPTIGDSPAEYRDLEVVPSDTIGGQDQTCPWLSAGQNPRSKDSTFLLSFKAGYGVFRASANGDVLLTDNSSDTYAVFKCNSFPSPHCHHDATSFILYGLNRDWLIDSGQFSYEEQTPQREYMRSARAHNVLRVDGEDFDFRPIQLVSWGRDEQGDMVSIRHRLTKADHVRTFKFLPPMSIDINDVVTSTDHKPHRYEQIFHVAPDVQVINESVRTVILKAKNADCCIIRQEGDGGRWLTITGQVKPNYQGWYSPAYNKILEAPALVFSNEIPMTQWILHTHIALKSAKSQQ